MGLKNPRELCGIGLFSLEFSTFHQREMTISYFKEYGTSSLLRGLLGLLGLLYKTRVTPSDS